jgi:protein TonB
MVAGNSAHLQRLAWMLALSACLHAALILGVAIKPAGPRGAAQTVIEARLLPAKPEPQPQPQKARQAQPKVELAPTPQPPQEAPVTEVAEKAVPEPVQPVAETPAAVVAPPDTVAPSQSSPLPALDIPLAEDPTYYPGKVVDVHPQPLHPEELQNALDSAAAVFHDAIPFGGIDVTLVLLIDELGKVQKVSVDDAVLSAPLEESVRRTFLATRYTPAIKDGRVVKSRVVLRVSYPPVQPQAIPMPRRKPAE